MTAIRRLRIIDTEDDVETSRSEPAIRVAIATQDLKNLNAHFGSARNFSIYDVTRTGWNLVETVAFGSVSDQQGRHAADGEDLITPKVDALAGCHLLFCLAIGGPSAARVVRAKIHPIKVPGAQPIDATLERTRVMLNGAPPPWLRKVLVEAGVAPAKPSFADDE
jgi:nitrogen fixation protein NifX